MDSQLAVFPKCPLCAQTGSRVVQQLTGAQLARLWQALGRAFTPEAWGPVTANTQVPLWRCNACGFEFFDPALAGNAAFYGELEREGYYSPSRPEFVRTLRFVARRKLRRILDVGCGSGSFLNLAREAGLRYRRPGAQCRRRRKSPRQGPPGC